MHTVAVIWEAWVKDPRGQRVDAPDVLARLAGVTEDISFIWSDCPPQVTGVTGGDAVFEYDAAARRFAVRFSFSADRELTAEELDQLTEDVRGQVLDGYGEGREGHLDLLLGWSGEVPRQHPLASLADHQLIWGERHLATVTAAE